MGRYTLSGFKTLLPIKLLSKHHHSNEFKAATSSSIQDSKSTVDPEDVKRHTKQAKGWWDPNGAMRFLHSYNLIRVPFVRDGLVPISEDRKMAPLSNISILDVGCGGGFLTEALARIGANVTGVDASEELIEVAKEHCQEDPKLINNRPTYYCNTVEEHSQQFCNHYDAVVASEIIEHVNDKELFVKSCLNALKPGGIIFFTTPTRSRMTQIFGIYVAEYILGVAPKGTHQYEKLITPNELIFLLERNNCHVQVIHGIALYAFTNKWHFVKSTQLMFCLRAVKKNIKLRYLAVSPTASMSQLRQKVWHLLELPDYCEEIIMLKRENHEIPLTELRRGNDPHHPYVLEVWLPGKQRLNVMLNNMLTMDDNRTITEKFGSPENILQEKVNRAYNGRGVEIETSKRNETIATKRTHSMENKQGFGRFLNSEYKKSDVSCKMSNSSIFFKLHSRKSRDNFANMLLKIQSDLSTLNTKLSDLENRITV